MASYTCGFRFPCHSTAFLYRSATVQNTEITHSRPTLIFTAVTQNGDSHQRNSDLTSVNAKPALNEDDSAIWRVRR